MVSFQFGSIAETILKCNETYESIITASVAEWLRAWDTLTMFEATVCGRS